PSPSTSKLTVLCWGSSKRCGYLFQLRPLVVYHNSSADTPEGPTSSSLKLRLMRLLLTSLRSWSAGPLMRSWDRSAVNGAELKPGLPGIALPAGLGPAPKPGLLPPVSETVV